MVTHYLKVPMQQTTLRGRHQNPELGKSDVLDTFLYIRPWPPIVLFMDIIY